MNCKFCKQEKEYEVDKDFILLTPKGKFLVCQPCREKIKNDFLNNKKYFAIKKMLSVILSQLANINLDDFINEII